MSVGCVYSGINGELRGRMCCRNSAVQCGENCETYRRTLCVIGLLKH
jgi:hypothetical protein